MSDKNIYPTFMPKSGEAESLTYEKLMESFRRVTKDCPPLTPIILDPHVQFVGGKSQIVYEIRPGEKNIRELVEQFRGFHDRTWDAPIQGQARHKAGERPEECGGCHAFVLFK